MIDKGQKTAGLQRLMPVILATWEAETQRFSSKPAQANSLRPYLEKKQNQTGLVEQFMW
jgi:hypothetical protein